MAPAKQGYVHHQNGVRIMRGQSETINWATGLPEDRSVVALDSPEPRCALKVTDDPLFCATSTPHAQCALNQQTHPPPTPHLSSLRHWKWMEDRSSSTPVLSGSCLHSCMQCRSAASKSPDWYSRCASSANPWKESIRFVGSGAPTHPKEGGNNMLEVMEEMKADKWKQKINKATKLMLSVVQRQKTKEHRLITNNLWEFYISILIVGVTIGLKINSLFNKAFNRFFMHGKNVRFLEMHCSQKSKTVCVNVLEWEWF